MDTNLEEGCLVSARTLLDDDGDDDDDDDDEGDDDVVAIVRLRVTGTSVYTEAT